MPYIHKQDRLEVSRLGNMARRDAETPGELNFILTELCGVYIKTKGLSYQTINDIIGALEGAKLEFYRRVASKYEDQKILENGDIY